MESAIAGSERNCRGRKCPSSRRWSGRVWAIIESMGPAIFHGGDDDRTTARGHYRRACRPIRVAIEHPWHRLKFPDDAARVMIQLDHAQTVVGRRLGGITALRISSSDVKTVTSARHRRPYTATASGVCTGPGTAIRKSAVYCTSSKTHGDNSSFLNRVITLISDSNIDMIFENHRRRVSDVLVKLSFVTESETGESCDHWRLPDFRSCLGV